MRIPTLAIGLGMQTMNVICGGTLFQHLPEDIPRGLHHRDSVENCLRHIIDIVPGTRMDKIYGPGEIRVNSQHHMAVDQVASAVPRLGHFAGWRNRSLRIHQRGLVLPGRAMASRK